MDCIKKRKIWPNEVMTLVSCGKCIPCLSNKRADWIFRLDQEHKVSSSAMFVTLTYHPKFLPDGLVKSHLQKFLKRLRKRDPNNRIRYFAVGEYGSKTGRPHYHILLFNADSTGETVRKAWTLRGNDLGIVDIRPVTAGRVRYITKYIIQPELVSSGMQKPFSCMSRGYGIGAHYLSDDMVDWHTRNDANYTFIHGVKGRLPRYYKEKIWYRAKRKIVQDGIIIPGAIIMEHPRRSIVAMKSRFEGKKRECFISNWFIKRYGDRAPKKRMEMRNAMIQKVKTKVAFTQLL